MKPATRFFVYGRLKSDERKSWMIPFADSAPFRLRRFKVVKRPDGAAAMVQGNDGDFIDGEIRQVTWTEWPIIGRLLRWVLLKVLDLNEGTYWGVYKRMKLHGEIWLYLYNRPTGADWPAITEWHEKEQNA